MQTNGAVPNLIPGLNRAIYQWDGAKLNMLPFTADDLIDSTKFVGEQGFSLVGSKTNEVTGINVQNGKVWFEKRINVI